MTNDCAQQIHPENRAYGIGHRLGDGGGRPGIRPIRIATGSILSGSHPAAGGPRRRGPRAAGRQPRRLGGPRAHILAHFQEVAGPLPGGERRVRLALQVVSTQQDQGFVRKKITFATEPGDRVPAWLLIPDEPGAATSKHPPCCASTRPSRSVRTSRWASAANPTYDTPWSWPGAATSRLPRITPTSASTRSTSTSLDMPVPR